MKVKQARFVLTAVQPDDFICDGLPQIAFVGRSNVGKSSLLNCLVGLRALARTSSDPGKTRAVNYFLIESRFYFVDLPGFGYAKAPKQERRSWAKLVDQYFQSTRPQPQVIQLVDAKVGATPLDVQALDFLSRHGDTPTVVATKIDRLPRSRWRERLAEIQRTLALADDQIPIPFSARKSEGVKELWRKIYSLLYQITAGVN